jgi:quercetin dioxygenase-like cupin family protein
VDRIDIPSNNAGQVGKRGLDRKEWDVAEWDDVQAANVRSVFAFCQVAEQAAEQASRAARLGFVVNVALLAGFLGIGYAAGYAARKGEVACAMSLVCDHRPRSRPTARILERRRTVAQKHHPMKPIVEDIAFDRSLTEDRGWYDMDVKWLITNDTVGSKQTVVGRTVFPPGAKHDLHRHPNAEEWEYVLEGTGVKRVGKDAIEVQAGDIVFVPADEYHGLENPSQTERLITIWGYCGASSLAEAGYFTPEDEGVADSVTGS